MLSAPKVRGPTEETHMHPETCASRYVVCLAAVLALLVGSAIAAPVVIVQHGPDPSLVGQGIVVSTHFNLSGLTQATGVVTISDGTHSCTARLPQGFCLWTPTTPGLKTLTATYPGDGNILMSSDSVAHMVEAVQFPERISLGEPFLSFDASGWSTASRSVAFSINGRYIAFISNQPLIPGDTNAASDAYFLDRNSGELSVVSVNSTEGLANGNSSEVAISADGEHVAFTSAATNLDGVDSNGVRDVFLRNRILGTTVRVSVTHAGAQSAFVSHEPDVSADGGRVVFKSFANLAANDTNDPDSGLYADVFLRDLTAPGTTLISVNPSGFSSANNSFSPVISNDGSRIAFLSTVNNLVGNDLPAPGTDVDAFLRDLNDPASTTLISVNSAGMATNHPIDQLSLSPDGSKAVFRTAAGFDPADTTSLSDCYLRDMLLNTTALASFRNAIGGPGNSSVAACAFAGTAAVYFLSAANDLVTGPDEPSSLDLFKSVLGPTTTSRITAGDVDRLGSNLVVASDDGSHAGFFTFDSGLVPGLSFDFAIYNSDTGGYSGLKVDRRGNQNDQTIFDASVSTEGLYVAFASDSRNLLAAKRSLSRDIFVRNRQTNSTSRVSVATDGTEANGNSSEPVISADGRHVAFLSAASNLVLGDTNGQQDVFVHDRNTQVTLRVSVDPSGANANNASFGVTISADGRYVVFASSASNLLSGTDLNGSADIFRWDRTQSLPTAISRISVASDESEANDFSDQASISADGNKVAFGSRASNLSAVGGTPDQVFLRDVAAGLTTQISTTESNGAPNGDSYAPKLSGDGNTVVFVTAASNLAPTIVGSARLLRRDLVTGTYTAVLDTSAQAISVNGAQYANLSDDGRYLVLESASQLDPADGEGGFDLYVYDFDTASGRVVRGPDGLPLLGARLFADALSSDGQYLTTSSTASNLVTGDTNGVADLFLFQNPAFDLALIQEVETLVPTANDDSLAPASSASGQFVMFQSDATNIGSPDGDIVSDIYRVDTETETVLRFSVNNDGSPITSASIEPSISADGEVALFVADDAGVTQLFGESPKTTAKRAKAMGWSVLMRNRIAGTSQRMAVPALPGGTGTQPQLAPGATALVYTAANPALPTQTEIFHIPLERVGAMLNPGTPRCVSCKTVNANGSENSGEDSNGSSRAPTISADGQSVAWETDSKNLLAGTSSPCAATVSTEIMLRNLLTGVTQRMSAPASPADCGAAGNGSKKPKADWKGRRVVFESTQPLKPGDANGVSDVFLFDLDTRNMTRVSETAGGGDAVGASTEPTISGDGEMVAFVSAAANLDGSDPDTNGFADAHVRSMSGGANPIRRLSRTRSGDEANRGSRRPALNYNGTRLAFDSDAGNLAPGADLGVMNVFQRANPLNGEVIFGTGFE